MATQEERVIEEENSSSSSVYSENPLKNSYLGILFEGQRSVMPRTMVEYGWTREQTLFWWEQIRKEAQEFFPAETAAADPEINSNLRLLFIHFGGRMFIPFLEERLAELYTREQAQKIVEDFLHDLDREPKARENLQKAADFNVALRIQEFKKKVGLSFFPPDSLLSKEGLNSPKPKKQSRPGTHTKLVPCPECKLEKRVTPGQTRRFKCSCGFDKPYPF